MQKQERSETMGKEISKIVEDCTAFLSIYNEDSTLRSSRDRYSEIIKATGFAHKLGHGDNCQCPLIMILKLETVGDRVIGLLLDMKENEIYFLDRPSDEQYRVLATGMMFGFVPYKALGFRQIGIEELSVRNYRPFHLIALLKKSLEDILAKVEEMIWEQKVTQSEAKA